MVKKVIYFITNQDKTGIELALENQEDEVTICLLQNAVYLANKTEMQTSDAIKKGIKIIAGKEDVEIRGLKLLIFEQIELKDYGEIIDCVIDNESIINI